MCYVPDFLSTREDSFSRREILCVNKPLFRRNKIISPFLAMPNSNPLQSFMGIMRYETTWGNKTIAYTFGENDSDNDEAIDETKRQLKLQKDWFQHPLVKSSYDLAGNAYLQEDGANEDPRGYVATVSKSIEGNEPIRDILDYYYEEKTNNEKDTYNLGELPEHQYRQLLQFLKQNTILFAWEEKESLMKPLLPSFFYYFLS
ncbi:18704_t:CDS:2 [Gigaspora rosea]|nr:18704_t:CDS:2 [Gigaspora rosea]